ncbi:bifunctional diguanylate cyclase/phosphodiesterase [Marinimicrobium sp. ABcell2]|uniref:putative bifunctional diguanylate cyclase/phosphodiesterase n=1 Tax=Marinimicrobium sp. ABcell2 TaxID=3069751 RepID=UPI0027B7F65C|nr:EAL domain-containing protein [Marinimicrobium sp. ABcell2]MDQ2077073.1 EAL domain-containing protein [Marinimicrobium sp. ABcell2]
MIRFRIPRSHLGGLAIVSLLLSSALAAQTAGFPDRLVFGGDRNYPPFERLKDEEPSGFNVDLAQALGAQSGTVIEHRLADWPTIVRALEAGEVDVVPMLVSPQREEQFLFTTPFHYIEHAIYARADVPPVYAVEDLVGAKVAVESRSFAQRQLEVEDIRTIPVLAVTTPDALNSLVRGDADYAILAAPIADRLIQTGRLPVSRLGPPFWPRGYAFAVREDRPELHAWLQQELELTIATGAYQGVYNRWRTQIHPMATNEKIARIMLALLLFFLGVAIIFVVWSWSLRRQVAARTRDLKRALEQTQDAESQARYLADYDLNTELAKPLCFARLVDEVLCSPDQASNGRELAIMQLAELDEVVGAFGRVYSQELIRNFAQALRQVVTGPCGYFGRGVFATLADSGVVEELPERLATEGHDEAQYFHFVTGSARYPEDGRSSDRLIKCAETALAYSLSHRSHWTCYSASLEPDPQDLEIVSRFRDERLQGIYSVFQPQLDLKTGAVVGVEALVRWNHPKFGMLPPARFIPLIEKVGMISHITVRMIDDAVRLSAQQRKLNQPLIISVNIAVHDLLETDLRKVIKDSLDRYDGRPEDLKLELTETSFAGDSPWVRFSLQGLTEMGVSLAIDDFGTGYSSLAYLSQFSVQELKIDSTFVTDMTTNNKNSSIVQSTIALAQHLGLICVAEGAEDEATLDLLRTYGCDRLQGFVFSRPLPELELLDFLKQHDAAQTPEASS